MISSLVECLSRRAVGARMDAAKCVLVCFGRDHSVEVFTGFGNDAFDVIC